MRWHWTFSGRPNPRPPPGGPAMAPPVEGSRQRVPRPLLLPFMADGSRLRPTADVGDSSAPSWTAATPPRPRSTASGSPSHLSQGSSTTASGSLSRSSHSRAARTPQHRDPPQQRGLSDRNLECGDHQVLW
ncbi:hypothetical protein DPX16_6450 [Anabarilius grahami]|uniref:Uncharacterized protein n=1 Tax=Anabarilius grahami TaxID=495550 RepID=A0A3N0YMX1_ANAGA|nr:hypothetical protein DPX16_6450 [Anabarilius grahami]